MVEHETPPRYLLPVAEIRAKLDATHNVGRDPVLGAQHTFALPEDAGTLQVFPTAGITRMETPAALVQVAAYPRVDPATGPGITLDLSGGAAETSLTVYPDGTVLFSCVPGTPERPSRAVKPPGSTPAPLRSNTTSEGHHHEPTVPADRTTTPPTQRSEVSGETRGGHSSDSGAKESAPRVQLTGRLGRNPTFRTSPRGIHIGSFSLAVHEQDGATTWHSIVAFGNRADQLHQRVDQGELIKGQEVNVIGYPHTRKMPTRTGNRTIREIHAVAVLKRG